MLELSQIDSILLLLILVLKRWRLLDKSALKAILESTSALFVVLRIELLGFDLNLVHDVLLVVNDSLLDTLNDLFTLKLEMEILNQDFVAMADTVDKKVYRRLNQCLVDVSYVCLSCKTPFLDWAISRKLRYVKLHAHHSFTGLRLKYLGAFMVKTAILIFKRQVYLWVGALFNKAIEVAQIQV